MHVGEHDVERCAHPVELGRRDGHRLDRQRPVGPVVLTDEAVALKPTGKRSLADLAQHDLVLAVGERAMPLDRIADPQVTGRDVATGPLADDRHTEMVRGHVELMTGLGRDPQHLLAAVALHRSDPREAGGIEDLLADGHPGHELADRHEAGRRADESVVRLARRDFAAGRAFRR